MKQGIIYLITNLVNGKTYVGQTKMTLRRRWSAHKLSAKPSSKRPTYIQSAFRKYGLGCFKIEILETTSLDQLSEAERKWITHFDSNNSALGYNLTSGGESTTFSESSCKLMSEVRKGRFAGENHPRWGQKHSAETKLLLSKSHVGIQAGDKHPLWGKSCSESTRLKISTSRKGQLAGESHPMFGKTHSAEARDKIAKAFLRPGGSGNTGKKFSDETKRKMSISIRAAKAANPISEETRKKMSIAAFKRKAKQLEHAA